MKPDLGSRSGLRSQAPPLRIGDEISRPVSLVVPKVGVTRSSQGRRHLHPGLPLFYVIFCQVQCYKLIRAIVYLQLMYPMATAKHVLGD